jgi:hypothetical protein
LHVGGPLREHLGDSSGSPRAGQIPGDLVALEHMELLNGAHAGSPVGVVREFGGPCPRRRPVSNHAVERALAGSEEDMSTALADLEGRFDDAMMNVYRCALSECDYNATRFLQMLYDHRGLKTARILLHAFNVSDGYVALWERHRLDLTVEALILEEDWHPLFSDQEREIARKRLTEYGHTSVASLDIKPSEPPARKQSRIPRH